MTRCRVCGARLSHPVEHDTELCEDCGPFVIVEGSDTPTPRAGGGQA